jgi:rfaE bifunctional protein kinase chain/domain
MIDNNIKKRLRDTKVLVVGDLMLDRYWFGSANRISPEAPVPVVAVSREEMRIGGAGNVAANISPLGVDTSLMSIVGRDSAADELLHVLKEKNIKDRLVLDSSTSTTIKTRVLAQQQQLVRLDFEAQPSADSSFALLELFKNEVNKYDAVIFSDYAKGALRDIEALIDVSRDVGKLVFVDPKGNNFSKYKNSSFLTPNRKELEAVTGSWGSESELDAKASELRNDLGLQGLLVTRSEEGMTLYSDSGKAHFPTRAKEVFDVSGAGDTVIAVFGALVAGGFSLEEASSLANKAAGVVVGKVGTATVTFDELFSDEVFQ